MLGRWPPGKRRGNVVAGRGTSCISCVQHAGCCWQMYWTPCKGRTRSKTFASHSENCRSLLETVRAEMGMLLVDQQTQVPPPHWPFAQEADRFTGRSLSAKIGLNRSECSMS